MSIVAIAMVAVFFVTSADSGALVVDLLASGGADRTPVWQRIFWSLSMGAVAIALLLADGLTALQTATIASALPFSVILLLSLWGLFKALKLDATKRGIRYQSLTLSRPSARRPVLGAPPAQHGHDAAPPTCCVSSRTWCGRRWRTWPRNCAARAVRGRARGWKTRGP